MPSSWLALAATKMRPPAATLSGGVAPSTVTKPLRYVQVVVPTPPPLPLKIDTEGGTEKDSEFPFSGGALKDTVPSAFSVIVAVNTYERLEPGARRSR